MALFNFRKSDQPEEEPQAEAQAEEIEELADEEVHVLNGGRRFFFVVEEMLPVRAGTVVRGFVHGRADLGDEIFLCQPSKPLLKTAIRGMNAVIESYMMKIQTAEDMAVDFMLPVNPADVEKYAVVTSVDQQFRVTKSTDVENPVLAAMLYEKKFFTDEEYFNLLCFELIRGCYITPAQIKANFHSNEDGSRVPDDDAAVGFCMLPDPKDKNARLLPVFTDQTELNKWGSMVNDEKVKKIALNFAEINAITRRPGCSGFVVNPYSGNRYIITRDIIRAIIGSEGYREMFPN